MPGRLNERWAERILLLAIEDITERMWVEEEREKLQEVVLKARKLESLGALDGGIAHDLNNLLYVVMGNISLAQDDLTLEIETSESLKEAEPGSSPHTNQIKPCWLLMDKALPGGIVVNYRAKKIKKP